MLQPEGVAKSVARSIEVQPEGVLPGSYRRGVVRKRERSGNRGTPVAEEVIF